MLLSTDNFKAKEKSEYVLNVLILKNEVIAIATHTISKEIEAFDKVGDLDDLSLNKYAFSDVKVIVVDQEFTLVPKNIFIEKEASSYLEFSTETLEPSEVMITENKALGLYTVWYLNEKIKQKVTKYWAGSSFSHLIAHKLANTNESNTENALFVVYLKNSISILLFTNQALQIANQFEINSNEDALYYLLLVLEQSKVATKNLSLRLSGTSSFKEKLSQYFNNIELNSYSNKCSLKITEEDKVVCSIL